MALIRSLLLSKLNLTTTVVTRSFIKTTDQTNDLLRTTSIYYCQERGARCSLKTVKRRKTHPFRYLIPKDAAKHESSLTQQNRRFLDEIVEAKFDQFKESPLDPSLLPTREERPLWQPTSIRCGIIGKKIGIIPYWTTKGKRGLTTLIHVPDNHVIKSYTVEEQAATCVYQERWKSFGLAKMVVGAQSSDPRKFTKNYCKLFDQANVLPKAKLTSMLCTEDALMKPGTPLTVAHFRAGDYVDVYGKTRDHGFQGVMRRWHFKGLPRKNTTKAHRRPGSIGRGRRLAGPLKGKKMPGHMGSERRGCAAVKVLKIDYENSILFLKGPAIPGIIGSWVFVYDTRVKERRLTAENPPPFPTYYPQEDGEELPKEAYAQDIHRPSESSIIFTQDDATKKEVRTGAKLAKVRTKK